MTRDTVVCASCGKAIFELATALNNPADGKPMHFECALEKVSGAEALSPTEKVVYIGAGAFAVVEYKDKTESSFLVKRRIQWDKEGEKKEWRKAISNGIINL